MLTSERPPTPPAERAGWRPTTLLVAAAIVAIAVAVAGAVMVDPLLPLVLLLAGLTAWVLLRPGSDVVTLLTVFVVMLFAIPSRLVMGPLKSAGSPALLAGLGCFVLWMGGRILPSSRATTRHQPVRIALFVFGAVNLASFAAAQFRPLSDIEARAADRGLMLTMSMLGIGLLACDGIPNRARFDTLIRRLIVAGAALAMAGIITGAFGIDPAGQIRIPGLTALNGAEVFAERRSDFRRVAATTAHAIEFSVVLAMLLPLAIQQGFNATSRKLAWWGAAAVIAAGIPLSLARSGVIGILAVAIMILPSMPRERRRIAYAAGLGYLVAMRLLFPGVLGTIKALFVYAGVDPSVTARTNDYAYVGAFLSESPLLGRGFGTFVPTEYDFIDNQYLVTIVETGLLGLCALLGLLLVGMAAARGARRRSSDGPTRDTAQALAAGILVALLTSATFDFFGFGTARALLCLLLGCAGALWRFERIAEQERTEVAV